jgi:hypothetical protein
MTTTVAERVRSNWTFIVGPMTRDDDRRYVTIAIKPPLDRPRSERVRSYGTGETARARLATRLLDLLRRRVEQAPSKSNVTSPTSERQR